MTARRGGGDDGGREVPHATSSICGTYCVYRQQLQHASCACMQSTARRRFTHPISFMIRTVFITLVYIYTHDRPTSRCPDACTTLFLTQPSSIQRAVSQSACLRSSLNPAIVPPTAHLLYVLCYPPLLPRTIGTHHLAFLSPNQRSLTCPITTGRYPTVQYAETRASTTPHKYRPSPSIPYWTGGRRRASSSFHHRTSRRRPPVLGSLSHRRLPPRPVHATVCLPPRGGLRGASRWSDVVP